MLRKSVIVLLSVCSLARCVPLSNPRLDGRIVGGTDAKEGEIPYQVSLRSDGTHMCGGSVISENWAITAGHCIYGTGADERLEVMVGSVKISGGSVHKVVYHALHANYDPKTLDWDIAVIKVDPPFLLGESVKPIALPAADEKEPADGTNALVSGWGYTEEVGAIPETLQKVTMPIVDRNDCSLAYITSGGITEQMICAGYMRGGVDSCQGDSGGPPVIDGKLQGVVSWGRGCARPNYPGVYSLVSSMRSFIKEETGI